MAIPSETKKVAGQKMKMFTFWLPILLHQDESNPVVTWAVDIGVIDEL